MPEFANSSRSDRTQVDPRNYVSSSPNLKVVSQPVDIYTKEYVSSDAENLVDALKSWNQASNVYLDTQEKLKKENAQKGIADARMGKAKDAPVSLFNAGYGYNEAFDITDGEYRGLQFQSEYEQQLKENKYFVDAGDKAFELKEKLYQDLYDKHFAPIGQNETSMFGASEHFTLAKIKGDAAQNEALNQKRLDNFISQTDKMTQDQIYNLKNTTIDSTTLQQSRNHFDIDYKEIKEPFLTKYGINRDAYTKATINNIGVAATKIMEDPTLTPEQAYLKASKILSIVDIPGTDGQVWSQMKDKDGNLKFRPEIEHYHDKLVSAYHQKKVEYKEKKVELQEAEADTTFVSVVMNPKLTTDDKVKSILANPNLKSEDRRMLVVKAESYKDDFTKDDHEYLTDLRYRIETADSPAKLRELRKELRDNSGVTMKFQTYNTMMSYVDGRDKDLRTSGNDSRRESREIAQLGYMGLRSVIDAIPGDQIDEVMTNGSKKKMDKYMYSTEYWNRVGKGENPLVVRDEIAKRVQTSTGNTGKTYTQEDTAKLTKELETKYLQGKISDAEYLKQKRQLTGGK